MKTPELDALCDPAAQASGVAKGALEDCEAHATGARIGRAEAKAEAKARQKKLGREGGK